MELGLTFPLQRFLGIKTPAWGTEPDRAGLTDSLTAAGLSPARVEGYLEKAGPACLTRTHGRREVAFLNRAWEDVLALDLCLDTERQAQPLLDRAVNTCSSRCAGFEGLGTGLERISASLL